MVDGDDRAKAQARVKAERQKVRDAEAEKALRKMASEGADMAVGSTDPPPPPASPPPSLPPPPDEPSDQDIADAQRAADGAEALLENPLHGKYALGLPTEPGDILKFKDDADRRLEELKLKKGLSGCVPGVVALIIALGLGAATIALLHNLSSDDTSKTATSASAAASSCSQTGARADDFEFIACDQPAGLDGHWVLVDGLQNATYDMGEQCSQLCDDSGRQTTIDKASATIDISGTKVTGGTFKTGYSTTAGGDPCTIFESRVDAAVTGGVDVNQNYGQLIVDGTDVFKDSCDSNHQQIVTEKAFHTSRFFFLKGETLVLCYNIDPNTFAACTTTGLSDPAKAGDGTIATFDRG